MKKVCLVLSVVSLLAWQQRALAIPTIITDTTAGTAVNDGNVTPGEYVGFSTGINSGFGNVIGSGSQMHIDSDTSGNLNIGFIIGNSAQQFNNAIVIYIDSTPGGFSSTATFGDQADGLRRAISGSSGGGTSVLTFASGFLADYAIAMDNGFAGLWQLASGGTTSLLFQTSANLNAPNGINATNWEVNLTLANLGAAAGSSFNYVATYLDSGNAFRSDEFHGVAQATANTGNIGQNPITLAVGDFNTFQSIPEPSTMAMAALGVLGLALHRIRRRK